MYKRSKRNNRQNTSIHIPRQQILMGSSSLKEVRRVFKRARIVHIPRNRLAPDCILVDLTFPDTTYTRTNNLNPYVSWRYRMGSIYDPDPTLGTGAIPGYTEWAAFYNGYRVLKFSYSIDLSNLEASPVDVFACPTILDLGANYVSSSELFGNPYCTQYLCSAKGGMDRATLRGTVDLGEFVGNVSQYVGDDGYGGTVGGNPSVNVYFNVGGVSATNFTVGNGLDSRITLVYTTLLYQRKTQLG